MPEELSRAEKVAQANKLRVEISSLRIQAEQNEAVAHSQVEDEALDRELARLEVEAAEARTRAESSGSVDDALAAMNAAAVAAEKPVTPAESVKVVSDQDAATLTPDLPAEGVEVAPVANVKKAGGNK